MTLLYMLDTNIVSSAMDEPLGRVGFRITAAPENSVAISAIVLGELLYGYVKKPSSKLSERLQGFLARVIVLPLLAEATREYGESRAFLERLGAPIGSNDLWIAAHALLLDLTLVTDNVDEFRRVPGLRVENWLRDDA